MAHFAVSDIDRKKFLFRERLNRGYEGKAGAATDRYLDWNEDWKVEGDLKAHLIQMNDRGTRMSLRLSSTKPPVMPGDNGLSQEGKAEGRASDYYWLPRMMIDGE